MPHPAVGRPDCHYLSCVVISEPELERPRVISLLFAAPGYPVAAIPIDDSLVYQFKGGAPIKASGVPTIGMDLEAVNSPNFPTVELLRRIISHLRLVVSPVTLRDLMPRARTSITHASNCLPA